MNLPEAFEARMQKMLPEESDAFFASMDAAPLHALRMNPLKSLPEAADAVSAAQIRRSAAAQRLADCFPGETFTPVPWISEGFFFEPSDAFRPGRAPYHAAGLYYIQDASAMAAAVCLDAQPGEAVLDLCAAPGGKSTQIAAAMRQEGLLVANEIIPSRARILSENIERMGIRNAIVTNASPQQLSEKLSCFFDRILVDAPCSGEGMFRKNPDAVGEWSEEAVRLCAQRQDDILSCAAQMLRPGGTMVYSTCTFSPEENEGSLTRFLAAHPDFYPDCPPIPEEECTAYGFSRGRADLYPGAPAQISRTIRIFPHRSKGEGHFIAVLKKDGDLPSLTPGTEAGPAHPGLPLLYAFAEDSLRDPHFIDADRLLSFGEQLYLLPDGTPPLTGIKVLRPGLHLGTFKKNRFEPSHALALSLHPQDALRSRDLTAADAQKWIGGQTLPLPPDAPTGWTLITVGGYSLGWGKSANGMLKNHYPKGLRRP